MSPPQAARIPPHKRRAGGADGPAAAPIDGEAIAPALFTIGYEGEASATVLAALAAAGVRTLIDVRALPLSRKPGFSKRMLAAELAGLGIEYVHLRGLGTPAAGRQAARAGRTGQMQAIFRAHMEEDAAQIDLVHARAIARDRPCCLLCFEADPHRCHRLLVAEMIVQATGQEVRHL